MGVSKVILVDPNTQTPEILMDVTGDDTSAGVLLAGNVGTRNDGEKVTGTIPEKTSSDLTVSGATVTAPAGHYASSASATVASGTAGTPTATKGSVSNHSVNVTPSVTNTTGYISGGTQTGTPVSVSASELVSGTKSISANGTGIDVTNYAAVDVNVATEMPGLENALCFSSPSSFTLQIGTNGLTAAQVWNHMEWTDAATPQSVWATWDGSTTLTATNGKLYLRGTGNTSVTGYDFMRSIFITFQFTGADIECRGNIETLLDYETVAQGNHPTMDAGCYGYLFFNSPITTAPSLPATTLTDYCYYYMFCRTALTSAPSLPATTLATSCYSNMFYGCTALTSAPSLPATTLATSCYERMFYNCTALTSAPALPTTTLSNRCYCYMFNGCTALTSAPALPATTLTTYCYSNMFHDCTALTSAPVLSATTLANYCYYSMFYGCTALTSAPELPATTLTTCCYQSMFYGCTALTSAPSLPATTLATYCYQSMFRGCTALTSVPVLPATTLANYCYNNMFYGCSSIKLSTVYDPTNYPYAFRIPESGTGVDATGSFNGMFTGTGGSFADTPTINTVYYLDKPLPVDFTVDGDATASDILPGKISYANGSRVVGNMASKSSSDLTISGQTVTAPAGYYPSAASASVPATPLQTKSVTPTESAQTVTPDAGYALSEVDVGAISSTYVGTGVPRRTASDLTKSGAMVFAPAGYYAETAGKSVDYGAQGKPTISVDSDGLITASATDTPGYITGTTKTATEQLSTQAAATITPSETVQTAVAAGKYTTGAVTVDAIPSDYVGSAIDQRDSSDLTASGATVTAPAGYYEEAASKTVASGSATAPASISGTSATVSTGTNTLTLSKTVSVTPSVTAGYISAGTAGNSSVSLQASVTTKAAATITPGTSNQTIAAGTYLTGAQTIAGSANLVAGNIKSGVNIFGKVGTFAGDATVYKDAWTSQGSLQDGPWVPLYSGTDKTAATIGDYAIFAGGILNSAGVGNVDTYNKKLVHGSASQLSVFRGHMRSATIGNYALFAGGATTSTSSKSEVDAYSSALVRTSPTALPSSTTWDYFYATTVGSYALIPYGSYSSQVNIAAYNTSLTRSTKSFTPGREYIGIGNVGNYALFAGGLNGSTWYNNLNYCNTSLTFSTGTALTEKKINVCYAKAGNYALFAGGYTTNGYYNVGSYTVDYYSTSLTHGMATQLSYNGFNFDNGITLNSTAIFCKGNNSSNLTADIYSASLTHSTISFGLDGEWRGKPKAAGFTTLGNYALVDNNVTGVDRVWSLVIPYILTVSVPANYTYTFDGETPTTVSSATSVTKTSGTPISGIVCKAATTKTGKIT